MNTLLLISTIVLWLVVGLLAFLVLGTLRAWGRLNWRLDQFEAVTPHRVGRSGLMLGRKAPDFTLPSVFGGEACLHDFAGRNVLLVFVQPGCGPCHAIAPELNRLAARQSDLQVLSVNNGDLEQVRQWARQVNAQFPVLVQRQWDVSKRYEVFATPFAFLIDEERFVVSKGFIGSGEHLGYLLSAARTSEKHQLASEKSPEQEVEAMVNA